MPAKRKKAAGPGGAATTGPKPRQSKLAKENNISAAQEAEINEAFSLFSVKHPSRKTSKEGIIPTTHVRRALVALGTPPDSPDELRELLETVDPDESGFVEYENFVAIAALKLHNRSEDSQREEIEAAYRLFTGGDDMDRKITLMTLKRIAKELKEDVDDQLLKDMISEANGGSGVGRGVGFDEFEGVMKRAGVFR